MSQAKKSGSGSTRNSDRPNGKQRKKHPGVSPKAHNGKTQGGYSPFALARRAALRNGAT